MTRKFLITGSAGFIGMHVTKSLLRQGYDVVGIDVVNDYYDTTLKRDRLNLLAETGAASSGTWTFVEADLAVTTTLETVFETHTFDRVIHLAAQAGVRHSLSHPEEYVHSNIVAFLNVLEACKAASVPHLVYASTSSVYGANRQVPFSESDAADHPLQFYAATKRANELMAHSYSQLFGLPTTGLRFFTVYGPWGRPDMAPVLFADAIRDGQKLKLFNHGNHSRDFTYIDDIVVGTLLAAEAIPKVREGDDDACLNGPQSSQAPYQLFNIGNSEPARLTEFIGLLENAMEKTVERELLPLQPGDVIDTYADISALQAATGYKPKTSLRTGVQNFIDWYLAYYSQ